MKIQIVSWRDPKNPKAGGAEVCLREVARRLKDRFGHSVRWFAPTFADSVTEENLDGIEIERRGFSGLIHFTAFFQFWGAKNQDSDFYIEDYHGVSLCTPMYLKKPGAILVHEVAGPIWFEMFSWPFSWIGFYLEKLILRLLRSANFITVSESTKKDLIAHGIPAHRIHVFTEASDLPAVARPLPLAQRQRRFAFVGRICKMKRVDLLLKAFAEFRRNGGQAELLLVGSMDPAFQMEFDNLVVTLNLGGSIQRTGFVSQEDKAFILGNVLALVSCSMHEGFGLVVVEANSQGTPAVTFDVNGYRDLIKPNVNGYLCPYGDVSALAAKLAQITAMTPQDFARLASSSLTESSRYSWDASAEQFNKILTDLMQK